MKKTISILLCLIFLIGSAAPGMTMFDRLFNALSVKAFAAASGDCGENLTWTLSDSGSLSISGNGRMKDFYEDSYLPPWDEYSDSITRVVVGNGVTSIGDGAFFAYSNLQSVTLPDTLTCIGDFTFSGSPIKSIDIPDSVTELGEGVFQGCTELQTVNLSDKLTSVNNYTFSGCSNLKAVVIPDGVRTIKHEAFALCSSLESLTLPKDIIRIYGGAFYGCDSLKNVNYSGSESDRQFIVIDEHNDPLENAVWHYSNISNNVKIKVAGPRSVDERTNVFIVATAENVPDGAMLYMEIYQNGSLVDKWFTKDTGYIDVPVLDARSDIDYTVGVCDENKNNFTDENGNAIRVEGGKISVRSVGFFQKIILFFKALFNRLPSVTVRP